ncbi:MAG: hypothetical protein AB7V48_03310 [Sedimentibacter sp.]
MINELRNKHGSTLVLLVIIIASLILLGTLLLSITVSQYKIRKSNSDVKRAFYISENGLNEAYLRVLDLMCEAADESIIKADEYISAMPDDLIGASVLFKNNYKQCILNNIVNTIYDNSNPYTDVTNNVGLAFISGKLTVKISSKYITKSGIEKTTSVDIVISVPEYVETKNNLIDFTALLMFNNFSL